MEGWAYSKTIKEEKSENFGEKWASWMEGVFKQSEGGSRSRPGGAVYRQLEVGQFVYMGHMFGPMIWYLEVVGSLSEIGKLDRTQAFHNRQNAWDTRGTVHALLFAEQFVMGHV